MQEVMYAENPQNVLTYFDYLQAVNVEKWTRWPPYYDAEGPVFYNGMPLSYINVGPRITAGTADGGGGSSSTGLVFGVPIAVVIVAGVLVWWLRRRRRDRAEEA